MNFSLSTEFPGPTKLDRNFAGAAVAENVKQREATRENFLPKRALNPFRMYECGVIPHLIFQPSFQAVQRGG